MTTITLSVEADTVELVLDALAVDAAKRQRAASIAALELEREGPKDRRPGAVLVAKALADAGRLEEFGRALKRAVADGVPSTPEPTPPAPPPDRPPVTREQLHADLEALRAANPGDAIPDDLPPSALDEDLEDEEGVIGADVQPELRLLPQAPV